MMGSNRAFVVGCYIPPSDLKTLACIDKAWCKCPKGAHPILADDLNLNLRALRTEIEETKYNTTLWFAHSKIPRILVNFQKLVG